MKLNAFTILEIIFVIVIIGIISAVALPKLGLLGTDAKVNVIRQDIASLKSNIQSYFIINQKIDKISDIISLNPSVWKIEDKKVSFEDNEKVCLELEITNYDLKTILKIRINETTSNNCKKLYNSGVRSEDFNLN
ncbi:prepilin-type N-terminal cleavage/methylation domain-containing protein [Arcobacter sp. FWKO B]|uniref:prepilin-type N-terminal cleavage/methylation domain-containing protein n=1 Tax=Arcobacter sp. FWKO B TaxID=2593672 RepID=UPI0018A529BB|nr:prepilin-type N-terminal cleavage/methylation domain-containing protein [Arcobacter sp. FWKO B]QOG12231.1 prepilin-type N-terminal cleavage/methylation domain-containing protein [Arcobacter sp. FWKO B]